MLIIYYFIELDLLAVLLHNYPAFRWWGPPRGYISR